MSRKGQLLRGEKWFLMNRDSDGNLKKFIEKDEEKMKDINLYLETRATETKPKVKK